MNFLQLCQRVRQECGISGTGPADTTTQVGELKRVVDWTARAYREICAKQNNWKFLRSSFTINTVAAQEAYPPASGIDAVIGQAIGSVTVGDCAQWIPDTFRIYKQSAGTNDRQFFWPIGYEYFRNTYKMRPVAPTRPYRFTERPNDRAILCAPIPDDIYVIEGEYYRGAPELAADADVPLIPVRFHDAIVFRACRYYAGYEEDGGAYSDFDEKYKPFYSGLMADQLPNFNLAGPLA